MPAPTMRLTLRTPEGERIQRETDCENIADAMAAYPGHSLVCIFRLTPEVGLVSFADGSRYVAASDLAANSAKYLLAPSRSGFAPGPHEQPAPPEHRAMHPGSHPDPACWGWWQPRCACGWRGELVGDEGAAVIAGELHVAEVAPTGESLDEWRRRVIA